MRLCPGMSRAEFAFLARPRATSRARDSFYLFESRLLGLHGCSRYGNPRRKNVQFCTGTWTIGEKSRSLTVSACVKQFSSILTRALREERHFALEDGLRVCNLGLASNRWGQELSPTQPSLRSPTAIMITCSNSPVRGAGCPIITSVIYCTPSRCPGSPACEPSFLTCS